jgi:ABC-type dipeptide/oligopeptide/nickel transport system permease subunit
MKRRLRFLRSPSGAVGFGIVAFVLLVAVFGPYAAPHSSTAPIGAPLAGPSGAGSSVGVLVVGVAAIQAPGISRIVRTATLEVSLRGYVEAAVTRGERPFAVIRREVLPNILAPVLVDAGLRFTFSILIIASVNFLGLGLQPPSSDWARMIGENREFISVNYLSVVGPAAMIALLTIGVNLAGDAIARSLGRSYIPRTTRSTAA